MKYECIKAFPGLGCEINDIVDIVKTEDEKYLIDETCLTDTDVVYEFFIKKMLTGWLYAPYSHSKMESWISCPKKFQYAYIIKPPSVRVDSPILEKGTLFHGILEFDIVNKLEEFSIPDQFSALTHKDAEEIIGQALTFTEESGIYKWIKSIKGEKISEQEMFLGDKLQCVDGIDEALIRGFIDLIIYDKTNNACFIFDWKTGGKSKESLIKWPKSKDQLELYAIWAYEKYGVEYIEASFVYVEHEHISKIVVDAQDIPSLKKKIQTKINNIENDSNFPQNLTTLCLWCDYKELCLGIPQNSDPRSMTKEDVFKFAEKKGNSLPNKPSTKNTAFLKKIKSRKSLK